MISNIYNGASVKILLLLKKIFLFKQHLTDVMYTPCCNVFILTVKIFCEKEKID